MTALTVEVARSDGGARRHFELEIREPAMVLDVLLALQRSDASLGFRYSCRVAMCGTCTIRIDGRPALACRTPVASGRLLLEPLAGLPVVRDLIVDTTPFWDAWRAVEPWFTPPVRCRTCAHLGGTLPVIDFRHVKRVRRHCDCSPCGFTDIDWTACSHFQVRDNPELPR